MKKILVIGELYSENLGDGIICQIVAKYFNKNYQVELLDLSGREGYIPTNSLFSLTKATINFQKEKIKRILYSFEYKKTGNNLSNIISAFKKSFNMKINKFFPDSIIFAGGQLFNDSFIHQIYYVCNFANKNNIKVIFNEIGSRNILYRDLLYDIFKLDCIKYISTRDNYEYISSFCNKNIVDNYDPAILCNDFFNVNKIESFNLGIGIMFSPRQSPIVQKKFWKEVLKELYSKKIQFKIFTNGSMCDQSFVEQILKELKLNQSSYLMSRPTNPEELILCINSFNAIISMRLHSLIISYSYNIPTLGISWDKKVNEFYKKIKYNNHCLNFKSDIKEILKFALNHDNHYNNNEKKIIRNKIYDNFKEIERIIK